MRKRNNPQPFLTPTLLKRQEEALTEAGSKFNGQPLSANAGACRRRSCPSLSAELAICQRRHKELRDELRDFIAHSLPQEFESSRREIESDLQDIFRGFFRSKAYAELASARILGREVPLLMPWDGRFMEGVIDVIYERNGLLYLADYKTDRIVAQ